MFEEFNISVTPLGNNDQYLVRTERVAPGVPLTEEQVYLPVEKWLIQAQNLMNDPLAHLLQGNGCLNAEKLFLPRHNPQFSPDLIHLGQELYDSLFCNSLRDSWIMAKAIAQHQDSVLRLRLGLKGNLLPRIPWEVLHISEEKNHHLGVRPLTTGSEIVFSRYQFNHFYYRSPQIIDNQPLRILMILANPNDQENLELKKEAYHLQEELQNSIYLKILEQPGRAELTQELERGNYQVFHYAGHSGFSNLGGDIYLVNRNTGLTETVYGEDLAGLLTNNNIKLAVFNSCQGADSSDLENNTGERNLAQAMLKRGIPAVLAMAAKIPDQVALKLTQLLYRNINQGFPIDFSLCRARQGLVSAYGSNNLYWALPVLYLDPEFDGFLIKGNPYYGNLQDFENNEIDNDPSALSPEQKEILFPSFNHPNPNFLEESEKIEERIKNNQKISEANQDNIPIYPEVLESEEDNLIQGILDDILETKSTLQGILGDLSSTESTIQEHNNTSWEESTIIQHQEKTPQLPIQQVSNPSTSEAKTFVQDVTKLQHNELNEYNEAKNKAFANKRKKTRFFKILIGAGISSLVTIIALSLWFFNQNNIAKRLDKIDDKILDTTIETSTLPLDSQSNILAKAQTSIVTNIAIEKIHQGKLQDAQPAVETLLDRNALPQAKAALDIVPAKNIDDPEISFLRGRLAWQFVKIGNKDFAVSDARRYWETAVKQDENSLVFLNALAFAYYAEGKYKRANQIWYDAIDIINKNQISSPEKLNTYAGLALGLRKESEQLTNKKSKQFSVNKALNYYEIVMREDPINFQADNLAKNWIWSEQAIKDWKNFITIKTVFH